MLHRVDSRLCSRFHHLAAVGMGHTGKALFVGNVDHFPDLPGLQPFFAEDSAVVKIHDAGDHDLDKICPGIMDFDHCGVLSEEGLEPREIREMVHIAHEEGFACMAHANGSKVVEAAAEAGIDSVEHGAYLHPDVLCAMKEMGVVWVPTLSTIGNIRHQGRFDDREVEKILMTAMLNVKAFAETGGLLAPGTDAGAWRVHHGDLTEYALLEQALGKDPEPVLQKGIRVIQEKF